MNTQAMLPTPEKRGALGVGLVGAVLVHVGIVFAAVAQPAPAHAAPPPVEIEIETPEPPKEEPPKEEVKEEPKAPEAKAEPTAAPQAPPPAAPPAAKAGALLTANDDAPKAKGEEPVSFVTDPNGGAYGSGVVQKGGTAEVGAEGAKAGSVGTTPGAPPAPKAGPPAPKGDRRRTWVAHLDKLEVIGRRGRLAKPRHRLVRLVIDFGDYECRRELPTSLKLLKL